ncbi:TadG family pilus assembly protein [Bosea sp. LjRoot9]|uniref:pilus assembly protein TadG-related protein n=1 Tax=Bosea sp. LjRoot9 TaxID=3342341 RepID=UPI003ECFE34E
MNRSFKAFAKNERGGAALLFAAGIFVLFGFGAMAVDVGSFFYEKRRQQTANDLAALAAAADLPRAKAAAQATAGSNGYPANTVLAVQTGIYNADATIPVNNRFTPSTGTTANAVKVEMRGVTQMLLGRVLAASPSSTTAQANTTLASFSSGDVPIGSSAIAVQDAQAAFAIGSRLAQLDGGLLNSLLSSLLGSSVSLSVMDYNGLAQARIDLFTFSKYLAVRANLSAVTYDDVLKANVKLGDVLYAAQQAARDNSTSSVTANDALSRLATTTASSTQRVDLTKLISFGPYGQTALSLPGPIVASLTALDLVSAVAQISNGTRQIDTGLSINIPGLAAVSLKLAIGERPVGTSLVSVGRVGATVHTAQTRLLLTINLVGSGQASLVSLPLYIELAAATARLSSVQCNAGDVTTSRVTLGVTPAVVDAWIGQVSLADFNNFSTAPNPPAAAVLNVLGLFKVTLRAHATMTNLAETPVSFTYPEILRGDKRTTSTQDFIATLLSRLFGDLVIRLDPLGLDLGGVGNLVGSIVTAAATPIDQLLTGVLGTLGIGLGQADSWVTGVRCGGSLLVR